MAIMRCGDGDDDVSPGDRWEGRCELRLLEKKEKSREGLATKKTPRRHLRVTEWSARMEAVAESNKTRSERSRRVSKGADQGQQVNLKDEKEVWDLASCQGKAAGRVQVGGM